MGQRLARMIGATGVAMIVAAWAAGCCHPGGCTLHWNWSLGLAPGCCHDACYADCCVGGAGDWGGDGGPPPEPYANARFHPVPTRPAFAPRDRYFGHPLELDYAPPSPASLQPVPDTAAVPAPTTPKASQRGRSRPRDPEPAAAEPEYESPVPDAGSWVFELPPRDRSGPERISRRLPLGSDGWKGR